jgi:hypothetical protein
MLLFSCLDFRLSITFYSLYSMLFWLYNMMFVLFIFIMKINLVNDICYQIDF